MGSLAVGYLAAGGAGRVGPDGCGHAGASALPPVVRVAEAVAVDGSGASVDGAGAVGHQGASEDVSSSNGSCACRVCRSI